jgi:hypothetical protein
MLRICIFEYIRNGKSIDISLTGVSRYLALVAFWGKVVAVCSKGEAQDVRMTSRGDRRNRFAERVADLVYKE